MGNKRFSRNFIRYFNRIRIKSYFFSSCLSFLFVLIFKRTPFASQKDSFYTPKGLLLHTKRTPFAHQKDSFCKPTLLQQGKRGSFGANFSFKFHNNYIKEALYECV